ncbi:hypothetical protein BU15DRAFT_58989 [Melanogaster broomeanus]|nr:hypothetical protein BU15DRAFT_58989 [Melanogaster broomeanus]
MAVVHSRHNSPPRGSDGGCTIKRICRRTLQPQSWYCRDRGVLCRVKDMGAGLAKLKMWSGTNTDNIGQGAAVPVDSLSRGDSSHGLVLLAYCDDTRISADNLAGKKPSLGLREITSVYLGGRRRPKILAFCRAIVSAKLRSGYVAHHQSCTGGLQTWPYPSGTMVDWRDPVVEARIGDIMENMVFVLVGLYGWEYFQSSQVEFALIRLRLSFRWPLIPYVVGRLSFLTTMIILAVVTSLPSGEIDCTGNAAIGCASTNLMIRTWLLWKDSSFVLCLLSVIAVGHWTILGLGLTGVQAFMTDNGCNVMYADRTKTVALLLYTMLYDLFVFIMTIWGLSRRPSRSPLLKRLNQQGIAYFALAFVANITPLVRMFTLQLLSSALITIHRSLVGSISMDYASLLHKGSQIPPWSPTNTLKVQRRYCVDDTNRIANAKEKTTARRDGVWVKTEELSPSWRHGLTLGVW